MGSLGDVLFSELGPGHPFLRGDMAKLKLQECIVNKNTMGMNDFWLRRFGWASLFAATELFAKFWVHLQHQNEGFIQN